MRHRHRHQPSRTMLVVLVVVVLAMAIAGCSRRGQPATAAGPSAATDSVVGWGDPTAPSTSTDEPAVAQPAPADPSPVATAPPASPASASPAPPTAAPLVPPDLTAIQDLLDALDAALGADATAGNDEGSPQ